MKKHMVLLHDMLQKDTPPASPSMDEDIDEDGLVYVEDVDEVIEVLSRNDTGIEQENEEEKMEEDQPIRDDAICTFTKHQGSVFCGSLSKDGKLAVTGGEDDKAFVWSTISGETFLECTGYEDSVIFADFNKDDSYLAVADMSGIVKVWKMIDKSLVWEYNMGDAIWLRWHTTANVLFGGSVDGEVYMWKIPSGECKILQGYGQRAETGVLMPDGKRLAIGYEDGSIRIMDLKSSSVSALISSDKGHNACITALDCHSDNKLLISTGVDGKTILSTSHTGKVIGMLQNLRSDTENNEEGSSSVEESKENWVEAAAFCKDPEFPVAATGTLAGEIFIWDISKQVVRHEIQQESGLSKLVWKETTSLLFSAGLDGVLRCFDGRSGRLLQSFLGHTSDILDMYISSDGNSVLTVSDDWTAKIFSISDIKV
ncbi:angio-associated migratory cell protein isoform X2 [Cephus cinctus]|uniref:Angio-associated migratory cell protein n=1 Tax=Cephus cinctus TaxID=211228 RepID=A0AAJ7BSC0_CEPCN|nr:angio-associated migratory cell protein isoform X2 [Cephus cinctus]